MNTENKEMHDWLIFDIQEITLKNEAKTEALATSMLCPAKGIICKAILIEFDAENHRHMVFTHHSEERICEEGINHYIFNKTATKTTQYSAFYEGVNAKLVERESEADNQIWHNRTDTTDNKNLPH